MSHLDAHDVTIMFLALGVLLGTARFLGEVFQRLGQPSVVGEIAAGILLGPTVLGRFAPQVSSVVFPADGLAMIVLSGMTTLAIALFLLVAGMEVELSSIWRQGRSALAVSLAGFAAPFGLGLAIASVVPYALGCEPDANPRVFALFFATAISISALPVIAKTLMDLNLYRSDFGMIVVAAAVFSDLMGWFVFAITLGLIDNQGAGRFSIAWTIAMTLAFAVVMLSVGRKLIDRVLPWLQAHTTWQGGVLGFAVALALLAAALTEWIGIHAIFGSFLVGVAIGDSKHLRQPTRETILDFVSFIFAPLFFASIGLQVDFAAKFYPEVIVPIVVIACAGKIVACGLAARYSGLDRRTSWAIGMAMNARGAMEIILGLLALQNGLIRQRMFVALVVMATVTSMVSGPAIQRILRRKKGTHFADFLSPRAFLRPLEATDSAAAIRQLAGSLAFVSGLDSAAAARAAIEREMAGGTGMGGQIAIPHARLAGLKRPLVSVGIAPQGIDFGAADGVPARLIILVLTSADEPADHLSVVADIANAFREESARESALAAQNYTQFLAVARSGRTRRRISHAMPAPVS